jgi:GYF domain 2
MPSPDEYMKQVNEIVGDDVTDGDVRLKIRWTNREEAKRALAQVRRMQTELRRLKQSISADEAALRSEFTTRRAQIGKSFGAGLAAGLLGRKRMGGINAVRRDGLRQEQLSATDPYRRVKRLVDAVIQALNDIKGKIENSEEYRVRSAPTQQLQSDSSGDRYHVQFSANDVKGPFSAEQVRGFLTAGVITSETEIRIEGVDAWVPVRAVRAIHQPKD